MTQIDRRALIVGATAMPLVSGFGAFSAALAQVPPPEFQMRFNIVQGRAVRHRPKVAVASYGASFFYTGRTQTANARAMIDTALYGVTPEMMAAVAEAGCQDLRARLAAAGETVVGVAETQAAVAASGVSMRAGNQNQGRGTFDGVTVAQNWLTLGSQTAPMVTGYSGEANTMVAGIGARNRLAAASAALDAIILTPVVWVDYARMGRVTNGVAGQVSIGVRAAPSGFIATAADARGRLVMATLVPAANGYSDRGYTADLAQAADTNQYLALSGVNRNDARILADPALWTPIATDAVRSYNAGLTDAIRQIRAS